MKISVIGSGNGGQAIAGHMAAIGHDVRLYGRNLSIISQINAKGKITLTGKLEMGGPVDASTNLEDVVKGAEVIMIATTATAHYDLARQLAPILEYGQVVILNPGRTCGAIEFSNGLAELGNTEKVYVAEAQTLVYACRIIENGLINIIGFKDRVLLASYPASETMYVIEKLSPMYSCFYAAENVLRTSFENIGAIFHPAVVLFNEATIERGLQFYFYRDMTPALANLLEAIDSERIAVAKAYGVDIISAKDWVSYAYDEVQGDTLCERMRNNPAYYEILAPTTINCRQITEDIPTGIVPMSELGKVASVPTPLFDALITMCSTLLQTNFKECGRNLTKLGWGELSKEEILNVIH
ncbi:NAD/NADP-dependent octopine/nopaline dehydrogenase family protein [Butyricimonas paravirosa]|uniref:NAD/NADP-dependent octopine/nopaline dehydrogenase family protein n=1 Tax=Butyricimonas paravirosa TaxID=1472417 RepID=UPI000E4752D5|nr:MULTISPECIES: NAD/NADP-dependent octopine/nopaline dehydrogenase family protein [Odoribacteraceae]RGG43532.1 NADP transhydrogenase subunit alpha [Odoribacter sp. AF21-41]RHH88774.1 NADP transhydrogenase subunit alpha [Odoribacter sp. AM16-33]